MHHYRDGGLENVWLANGYTVRQTPHGQAVSIHDVDGLTKAVCLAITDKPSRVSGKEFRFIRQAGLSVSQQALGKMLGADGQSVARWEKTGRVPKWADKLLRLVYLAQARGDEPIGQAIERARIVERLVAQKIVVQDSPGGWQAHPIDESEDLAA